MTRDSHDNHPAARTDWANHDWGSDASGVYATGADIPRRKGNGVTSRTIQCNNKGDGGKAKCKGAAQHQTRP